MYEVLYHPQVIAKDIPSLNRDIKDRIRKAIENRLTRAPADYGKPLRGGLHSLWRLRVGDYRIVYRIEQNQVKIIQIVNRKDAYNAGILEARRRRWSQSHARVRPSTVNVRGDRQQNCRGT
ncbi:MAG: type II toxin-antitoxin system RelE/ParE family toxin [Elusimicrobiota bacterium]